MKPVYQLIPVGSDDNWKIIASIVGIGLMIWFFRVYMPLLEHWRELPEPYSYGAAFYHYTLGYIAAAGNGIWDWSSSLYLTNYPFINLIVALLFILTYLAVILTIGFFALRALYDFGIKPKWVLLAFLSPVIIMFLWEIVFTPY